jgi:hypothetical protein
MLFKNNLTAKCFIMAIMTLSVHKYNAYEHARSLSMHTDPVRSEKFSSRKTKRLVRVFYLIIHDEFIHNGFNLYINPSPTSIFLADYVPNCMGSHSRN